MARLRLGVLGGTFDPVHLGHLVLAESAREQLALDRVLWVPAGDPWRKVSRRITPAEYRQAMVDLAIEGNAAFQLCTVEIDRVGPSYSVETLAELRQRCPESDLFFLLGQDALGDLPNWHEPRRLLELAALAVAPRERARPSSEELEQLLPGLAGRVAWVEMPHVGISATDLRQRASEGRSLRYLVPGSVEAYIRERRLYQRGR